MPKKTKKAKNTKVQTAMVAVKRELLIPTEDQAYAKVTRMLGNCRVECLLVDHDTQSELLRLGIIRHKLFGAKRGHFISVGDIVLVSYRDFQVDKVDVLHRYNEEEVERLVGMGEPIPAAAKRSSIIFDYDVSMDDEVIDMVIDAI